MKTIVKYGKQNIQVFIFDCESECQAFSDEIQQIKQLRDEGLPLVNQTYGGDGTSGYTPTKEQIAKRVESRKGYKNSEETKKKMSIAATGRKLSDETKKKLSDYAKNRTTEHLLKISKTLASKEFKPNDGNFKKGHKVSVETRAKMSARMMGNTIKKDLKMNASITPFDKSHCDK